MTDYNVMQKFLTKKYLHFFTFYTKPDKPGKGVIRHLPGNISAEDIMASLHEIDYDIISVKHAHFSPFLPPLPSYASNESKSSRHLQIDELKLIDPKTGLHSAAIVSILAISGCAAGSLPAACGVGVFIAIVIA
jgi:hypothetical protein